jgi:serine/threonine protein phosphatase PrpC
MRAASLVHVGRRRSRNDDLTLVLPEAGLVIVCDGADGSTAARMTAEAIAALVQADRATPPARLLEAALHAAATQVRERWDEQFYETATVGAVLLTPSGAGVAASVGDTRCYRLHDGQLVRLTGRAVAPARAAALRGMSPTSPLHPTTPRWDNAVPHLDEIEVLEVAFGPRDIGLVCTDGLHKDVPEPQIALLLQQHAEDPAAAARALVDAANAAGGRDNIGVAVFTA